MAWQRKKVSNTFLVFISVKCYPALGHRHHQHLKSLLDLGKKWYECMWSCICFENIFFRTAFLFPSHEILGRTIHHHSLVTTLSLLTLHTVQSFACQVLMFSQFLTRFAAVLCSFRAVLVLRRFNKCPVVLMSSCSCCICFKRFSSCLFLNLKTVDDVVWWCLCMNFCS